MITIWLLVSLAGASRPAALIYKYPDLKSCVEAHMILEEKPWSYKCIPAKAFTNKEVG